jgi:sarcosine oxidase subunit alpha
VKQVHGRREVTGLTLTAHKGQGVIDVEHGEVSAPALNCDVVAVSGGWTPTIHLYSQAGGSLDYDEEKCCFVPRACAQNVQVVGAANGDFDPVEGEQVIEPYWYTQGVATHKQWLDFQYDVKVSDIELAARENFVSVEHVKRYTTSGMSVDQGKTGNINTLAVMAELSGRKIPEVGTTKFRPPYHPATLGTFAGRTVGELYAPTQQLPAHCWHLAHGAHFEDYGWQRPDYYLQADESADAAMRREVAAARNRAALFDASPLGKIEVYGPDAARFLNKFYINNVPSLKIGCARYGMMCNENGVVIDDGVFVRLAEDHYLVHTTSGSTTRIAQWMEEWRQCEWPDMAVLTNNVTTQWATATLSGPNARAILQKLDSDIAFEAESFPHMHYREGQLGGAGARVLRASFTGEVSFELSVPARFGLSLWQTLMAAGKGLGITPLGVESLMMLRTEKGYLHVGADTDGSTNPLDVGWAVPIKKKVDDFIGRRSLSRPNDVRPERLQFVGLEPLDRSQLLPVGGHVIESNRLNPPQRSQGYVTSSCFSHTLHKSIALGIVAGGQQRTGEQVSVCSNGDIFAATIVSPTHFDPKGERLHG